MGCCFGKKNNIRMCRNELLALNREADKYGISLERYKAFTKSTNYTLSFLVLSQDQPNIDDLMVKAWNEWKYKQPWGLVCPDLTENIITQLAHAPTKINGYNKIPSTHLSSQITTLDNFYLLQDWTSEIEHLINDEIYISLRNRSCFIHWLLDNFRYYDIIQNIKNTYGEDYWSFTQDLDNDWLTIINNINHSGHENLKRLKFIKRMTTIRIDELLTRLDQKIII